MNIICNNCGGADFYNLSKQPFQNPFMWSVIFADDMIQLIQNYDRVDFNNTELVRLPKETAEKSNYYDYDERKKICGIAIDNVFTVYFTHYIFDPTCKTPTKIGPDVHYYRNFEYICSKYDERIQRMIEKNEAPIFVIIAFKRHGWNKDKIHELLELNPNHKVILITNVVCSSVKPNFDIIYDAGLDKIHRALPITYIKKYFWRIK